MEEYPKISNSTFSEITRQLKSFENCCCYFILHFVEISLPEDEIEKEFYLEELFEYFDDHEWPPYNKRPNDQTWKDYQREEAQAYEDFCNAMKGIYGNLMKIEEIDPLWEKLNTLFENEVFYYTGLGLGDPNLPWNQTTILLDQKQACVVAICEND